MPYSEEDFFDAIGFLGAVILATALLPQIYRVHIRRSAKDISYGWQVMKRGNDTCVLLYVSSDCVNQENLA